MIPMKPLFGADAAPDLPEKTAAPVSEKTAASSSTEVPQGTAQRSPVGEPENGRGALRVEDQKKRIPLMWIPVVICLGLLIAAGYVGRRILTSRRHAASAIAAAQPMPSPATPVPLATDLPTATPATPPQAEIPPAAAAPAAEVQESAPAPQATARAESPEIQAVGDGTLITPQPGQQYIQISALSTERARRYVEQLRRGPLEPQLAPGPKPEILRVLIGPFTDRTVLLSTRSDLQAAGIDCFIRKY